MEVVKEVFVAAVEEITIPSERIRKEFDQKDLRRLATSFIERGQKQPGICRKEGEKIILVAGERRLRACEMLDVPFHFVLDDVEEDNAYEIKKIELEENICRVDLSWQEKVAATAELHKLEQEHKGATSPGRRGGHSVKDTAVILHDSVGKVAEDLKLAAFASRSQEVRNAKTKSEARKIVKKLEEKLERYEKLEKAIESAQEEVFSDKEEGEEITTEDQIVYFSKRIHLGRMETILKEFPNNYFNVVCFDPPWRVDYNNVRMKGGGTDDFSDESIDDASFVEEMVAWLRLLWEKMHEDSHLYLFFGIVHHNLVYRALDEVGFSTNKIPLIWYKQGSGVTRNPDVWPGRSYEPIAFARKGSKRLVKKGAPDVVTTPAPTSSMKKNHPSGKHPMLYLELLQRSCVPGDKVLDPMCGSGMTGVAAEVLCHSHQLDWQMIEEKPDFRRLSILNVVEGFSSIIQKKEEELFEEPTARTWSVSEVNSFKDLEPGTDKWRAYWNAHPEEQEAMLEWRKKLQK